MWTANWHRFVLVILLLLSGIVLAPGNSDSRRLNWHEILVAQTATEMIERNDLLVPHILGVVRLKKPPLSYWLSVATHRVLGEPGSSHVSEFEARLPSLISGLLLIVVTYGLGLLLTRDRRGGLIAAGLIASSWSFYLYSRSARPEMLYALLCALMTFGLVWAIRRAEEGRSTVGAAVLAWGAFGLALMAKGPQFPIFIVLGVLLALLMRRPRLPLLKTLHPWMALLTVALPLVYYAYLALQFDNTLSLWGSEMMGANRGSIWIRPLRFYYPLILIVSLAPWIVVFGYMAVDVWKRRHPMALLLASCVLVSIFLVSFAGQFRDHYVLPLLPLCAALMAWSILGAFDSARGGATQSRWSQFLVWGQFAMLGILTVGVIGHQIFSLTNSGANIMIYQMIPWLVIATGFYVAAAMMLNRNLAATFAALVGTVLLASGAYPWIRIDESGYAASAYQFIMDIEAYLPEERVLYYDSGKHLHYFQNYYGKSDIEALSLEQWKESGETGPTPYFITQPKRFRDSGIQGEVLVEQRPDGKGKNIDEVWVLFRPTPRI